MRQSQPEISTRISEHQMRWWNVLHSAQQPPQSEEPAKRLRYRFITISRDDGSLGDEVAAGIANRLGWHVFDREIVNYIAEHNRVREDMVRRLDEQTQGLVHDAVFRLLHMPEGAPFGSEEYHESLLKTLATLATHGNAVLVGRGANFALRETPHGLHVRITASLQARLLRECERMQISPARARVELAAREANRRDFIRHHFRKDLEDPRYYDLTFNTDYLSAEQVTDSILRMAGRESPTAETRESGGRA